MPLAVWRPTACCPCAGQLHAAHALGNCMLPMRWATACCPCAGRPHAAHALGNRMLPMSWAACGSWAAACCPCAGQHKRPVIERVNQSLATPFMMSHLRAGTPWPRTAACRRRPRPRAAARYSAGRAVLSGCRPQPCMPLPPVGARAAACKGQLKGASIIFIMLKTQRGVDNIYNAEDSKGRRGLEACGETQAHVQ
eukprot:357630-Chlamydomonas_euryale.AAC.1